MKNQINPALAAAVIVVMLVVAGALIYRGVSGQRVDTSASMSADVKAKFIGANGGGGVPPPGQRSGTNR